nr:hypothetical protein CFP56_63357 [Quercus suber]
MFPRPSQNHVGDSEGSPSKSKSVRRNPEKRRQQNLEAQKSYREKKKRRLQYLESLSVLALEPNASGLDNPACIAMDKMSTSHSSPSDNSAHLDPPITPGDFINLATQNLEASGIDSCITLPDFALTSPSSTSVTRWDPAALAVACAGSREYRDMREPKVEQTRVPAGPCTNALRIERHCIVQAVLSICEHIGITEDMFCDDNAVSPFFRSTSKGRTDTEANNTVVEKVQSIFKVLKQDVRPIREQITHLHRPMVDALPFPTLRKNLITAEEPLDEDEFFYDLLNGLVRWGSAGIGRGDYNTSTGFVSTGTPWDSRSWEGRTWFLRKYWAMLGGEEGELVRQSEWWRSTRGEEYCVHYIALILTFTTQFNIGRSKVYSRSTDQVRIYRTLQNGFCGMLPIMSFVHARMARQILWRFCPVKRNLRQISFFGCCMVSPTEIMHRTRSFLYQIRNNTRTVRICIYSERYVLENSSKTCFGHGGNGRSDVRPHSIVLDDRGRYHKVAGLSIMESSIGALGGDSGRALEMLHPQAIFYDDTFDAEELFDLHEYEWTHAQRCEEANIDPFCLSFSPSPNDGEVDSDVLDMTTSELRNTLEHDELQTIHPSISCPTLTSPSSSAGPLSSICASTPMSSSPSSVHGEDWPMKASELKTRQRKRTQNVQHHTLLTTYAERQQACMRQKIERKYRSKLAINLDRLRASVPSLLIQGQQRSDEAQLFGLVTTQKRSKAVIISKAVEYIDHMKVQYRLAEERAAHAELQLSELRALHEQLRSRMLAASPQILTF